MRTQLLVAVGLGIGLVSACGGSTPTGTTGGTTGGVGTTGGSGTTTTTGGTTTTTTGGSSSGLANGAPCSDNGQCRSTVCGIDGSGNCCSAVCNNSASACTASACDSSGACVYPSGNSCGSGFCNAGNLTLSTCNGQGTCLAGGSSPCPNNFGCKDQTTCNTQCSVDANCVSGFYCAASQCVAQQATGPCTSNSLCISGFCDIAGSGNCCTAQCLPATDSACNPTSCDPTSGACVYPEGNTCGSSSCSGSTLTAGLCDFSGNCNPTPALCMNGLICNAAGTDCLTTCATIADCQSGFYCSGGSCLLQQATGPCTTNDACTTGICGINGTGTNCCTAACTTSNATCAATDCDGNGACLYPTNSTSCGAAASCSGSTETSATSCDGMGDCLPPAVTSCSPFICGRTTCVTSCTDNSSCVSGGFCDTFNNACCTGLSNNGTINVDAATGSDDACCGIGTNAPCATLTQAMLLIDAASAQNVTINATVSGGGGDWTAAETYPIVLGWGVELNAPGVFFLDANQTDDPAIFEVNFYSGSDSTGYASIIGAAGNPVGIGMNAANTVQTDAAAAIDVVKGNTLYIGNATVNGSFNNMDSLAAISVHGGGGLMLGQDQAGSMASMGTVNIGNALGQQATDGSGGIVCAPDFTDSLGCTINDTALVANSVIIQGQEAVDIEALDYSDITLTSSPIIGIPPSAPGFNQCPFSPKNDALSANHFSAVWVKGLSTVTFKNGMVQCIGGTGFELQTTTSGAPSVTIDNTTIQNTDLGIYAAGGTVTVTNSNINFNFNGVQQDTLSGNTGSINLGGGGNAVICSSNVESSAGSSNPGIDVYNSSTSSLDAKNVAWDTAGPDYFKCDSTFATCSCNLGACTNTPGGDDMDAVEDSTNLGGITTTGNTQSGTALDAGCS